MIRLNKHRHLICFVPISIECVFVGFWDIDVKTINYWGHFYLFSSFSLLHFFIFESNWFYCVRFFVLNVDFFWSFWGNFLIVYSSLLFVRILYLTLLGLLITFTFFDSFLQNPKLFSEKSPLLDLTAKNAVLTFFVGTLSQWRPQFEG